MDTKDILQKVRRIEIKTKRLSDHIFSGEYNTSFKGKGMSFAEVRQYQYGDDIRSIDWNVTARQQEPYVKIFEEERELTLMLLVDVSASQNFGSAQQFKKDIATEIAATLAFSAINNNDKVGLMLFSNEVELFIPPKKGKSHVLRIIRELISFEPKNTQTDVSAALTYFLQIMKKKTIAFVISDFVDVSLGHQLKIAAKKHDITGIQVYDKREKTMENIGLVLMKDAENGTLQYVDTADKQLREAYDEHFVNQQQSFVNGFKKSGAGAIQCEVNESYVKKLLAYFKSR